MLQTCRLGLVALLCPAPGLRCNTNLQWRFLCGSGTDIDSGPRSGRHPPPAGESSFGLGVPTRAFVGIRTFSHWRFQVPTGLQHACPPACLQLLQGSRLPARAAPVSYGAPPRDDPPSPGGQSPAWPSRRPTSSSSSALRPCKTRSAIVCSNFSRPARLARDVHCSNNSVLSLRAMHTVPSWAKDPSSSLSTTPCRAEEALRLTCKPDAGPVSEQTPHNACLGRRERQELLHSLPRARTHILAPICCWQCKTNSREESFPSP